MAPSSESISESQETTPASNTPSPTMDHENPFIAFRRFADSQISSLLQSVVGLPSLLSHPESQHRWPSIDDFVAKRRAEARARREFFEELERDMLRSFTHGDASKRQDEEMHKSNGFSDATKMQRSKENQELGRSHGTKGERLGWDGKQRDKAETVKTDEKEKGLGERFPVSTPEGPVNLKRVVDHRDEGQGFWMAKDDPRLNTITGVDPFSEPPHAVAWLLTDDYSPLYLDQTLPWKLHPSFYQTDWNDSYFREDYEDGDLYPRFEPVSILRHDPRLQQMVDWRAAFQDLLNVHHKGFLSPRSYAEDPSHGFSGWLGAGPWIARLVDQGSLGPQWHQLPRADPVVQPCRFRYGTSCSAWAVPSLSEPLFVRHELDVKPLPMFGRYNRENDALWWISKDPQLRKTDKVALQKYAPDQCPGPSKSGWQDVFPDTVETSEHSDSLELQDNGWMSFRPAITRAGISLIRDPHTEQATLRLVDRVLRMVENPELEDEIEGILKEAMGNLVPEDWNSSSLKLSKALFSQADKVLRHEFSEKWEAAKQAVDSDHPAVYGVTLNEPHRQTSCSSFTNPSDLESSSSFSSSSYAYKLDSCSDKSPTTILSTLTTVQTRTLPDGSVETKRILKKRFADGRDENSETTETQRAQNSHSVEDQSGSERPDVNISKTSAPQVSPVEKKGPARGWFWI